MKWKKCRKAQKIDLKREHIKILHYLCLSDFQKLYILLDYQSFCWQKEDVYTNVCWEKWFQCKCI